MKALNLQRNLSHTRSSAGRQLSRAAKPVRRCEGTVRCAAASGDGPQEDVPACVPCTSDQLAPELEDLHISEDGFLIDGKTGKVINEMGATRFDVAVRAIRGELSPPEWVEDTERAQGNILAALYPFPRQYEFQFVLKPSEQKGREVLLQEVVSAVCRTCQVEEAECEVGVKERLGGKFLSVSVKALCRAPEIVSNVYANLEGNSAVVMKF